MTNQTKIIFKIRSKRTGEFSKGGSTPSFSKNGKQWSTAGHVNSHVTGLSSYGRALYKKEDAEVVTFEIVEHVTDVTSISAWISASATRKADRAAEQEARHEKYQQELRRRQYEALSREFGGTKS